MKVSLFRTLVVSLYVIGLAAVTVAVWTGGDYYRLPVDERPHHVQHDRLKPGGLLGHGYGVVGSAMILLLFLYSARKRELFCLRWGAVTRWLDLHIWLGIMGPLFITVHTAGKFGGVVSVSYYAMVIVALSGFFGRYIYMQIPRDEAGIAMPIDEINTRILALGSLLHDDYKVPDKVLNLIEAHSGAVKGVKLDGIRALVSLMAMDMMRPLRSYRLRHHINTAFPDYPKLATDEILRLARQKSRLDRRRAVLGTMNSMFHHWHVFHKPLAAVMILIMLVHVAVAVLMGYKWVF